MKYQSSKWMNPSFYSEVCMMAQASRAHRSHISREVASAKLIITENDINVTSFTVNY